MLDVLNYLTVAFTYCRHAHRLNSRATTRLFVHIVIGFCLQSHRIWKNLLLRIIRVVIYIIRTLRMRNEYIIKKLQN